MNGVLLDTSAYVALAKNNVGLVNAVSEADGICMSPIVVGELKAGFRKGSHTDRNEKQLSEFMEKEDVQVLALDRETADRYAAIHDHLRRAGTPVAANDLWIAATAMQYGIKLLTTDHDFKKIPHILADVF